VQFYELFDKTDLKGNVPSSRHTTSPTTSRGEESGRSTERLRHTTLQTDAGTVQPTPRTAVNRVEEFEKAAKKKFVARTGQLKLLIVVDKLLTGFDAPPDLPLHRHKQMRDSACSRHLPREPLDGEIRSTAT